MPRTFVGRAILVTAATAVLSVLITALVALPIAIRSADRAARTDLAEKSALAVELLATERPAARARIVDRLRDEGIDVYLVRRGVADRPGLPERVIAQIAADDPVDTRGVVAGTTVLISGRPLSGNDSGVVLTRAAPRATDPRVLGGVWIALLAGLVGGVAAGALLAFVVARPLRQAALAAARLTAGDRSVRLAVRPPAEAAALATALNQLGAALQISEGREREFLLSVSHELRTPLATIRGYAEALADGVVPADGAPAAGEIMRVEADRLDRLISDLLVLSRLEAADLPVHPEPVDLVALVETTGLAWAPRCGPDGPLLSVELPAGPVVVRTDPARIRQVIDGLCENALRVLPAGAPLILAVRTGPGDGDGVVEIRDGGPGFTDEDLAVAFQRGALQQRYRHERKTGSGLGLALAARLVARLDGTIEAGHAPEGGAMFTVTLPRSGSEPNPPLT
ncbi:sensor histidine kinase [Catenuloplanes japonicus]|uniref:sensor histidine kinase n=1 Tax=Catenuloplanes japonicus TaxID=33876 RepID=UPI00068BCC34|nr:HAMP domain-containing sensor histidine kinase [Catenuloplanes japonicus]